ncbi:MAG: FtsH protease activity modulator HflK [Pseudomonadota bacterium]
MPYNSNNGGGGGPWGGGGKNRGNGGKGPWGGGGGGGGGNQQGPDLDDLIRKGRDQLRVVLGGKGGGTNGTGGGGGGRPGSGMDKALPYLIPVLLVGFWVYQSLYRVETQEQSVELFFGEFSQIGTEGLNFAPWPVVTYEKLAVTRENTIDIGTGNRTSGTRAEEGLMLTGDENIVDIDFQVVWNIREPDKFLFNLASPEDTIKSVSESAMREVIARSELRPILSRDRAVIAQDVQELIQSTLESYEAGVNIVRVNFDGADPPREVIDSFRDVQAAEQDRDTEEKRAEAYANQQLAAARGQVAQLLQEAEAYRAQVVNEAKGEASRFSAVYEEYVLAPEVTRKRLYLETIERVFGDVEKIIIDENTGGSNGQGVVPYLPLNELRRGGTN